MNRRKPHIRLFLTTLFAYLSYRVAPAEIKPILRAYLRVSQTAIEQIMMGRTFGLLFAGWSSGADWDRAAAQEMESAASAAAAQTRLKLEAMREEVS